MYETNYAFIDGQNLQLGTTTSKIPWVIDFLRFRIYLDQKYSVKKAYYYIGYFQEENKYIYEKLQESGYILMFREHHSAMKGKKKGNIDTDLVFDIMKKLYKGENFDKILLVSGDGDYKGLVDFLIEEKKFLKILFPNKKRASSLYKKIDIRFSSDMSEHGVRRKISKNLNNERASLGN